MDGQKPAMNSPKNDAQNPAKEKTRDQKIAEIVSKLKAENPQIHLVLIDIPDREEEIYIARLCSWAEYKTLIGATKNEAQANEIIVQKFLVYPKVDYEKLQTEWAPGLIITLAMNIQKALGFQLDGVELKKL